VGERFEVPALKRVAILDREHLFGTLTGRAAGEPFLIVLGNFPHPGDKTPARTSNPRNE
jgi:hypothetical protein